MNMRALPPVPSGATFARWTVLSVSNEGRRSRALCRCTCGEERMVVCGDLVRGKSKSCGCLNAELRRTRPIRHGRSMRGAVGYRTYLTWTLMIRRCTKLTCADYPTYGGRGIKVCDRWLESFENFLVDMGDRPSGTTIDRFPNGEGDYEPGNCRWATPTQQARNASYCKLTVENVAEIKKLIAAGGRNVPIAAKYGVTPSAIKVIRAGKTWKDVTP